MSGEGFSFGDFVSGHEYNTTTKNVKSSIDLEKMKSMPKDELIKLLADFKQEQIEKVQGELQVLLVIEDMMKQSGINGEFTNMEKFGQMLRGFRPDKTVKKM